MKAKTLISLAIIAGLPFRSWALITYVYTDAPANVVDVNGVIKQASKYPPYATMEPTQADETHIATTAYVKGAYNDTIAAVNKVYDIARTVRDKQDRLGNDDMGYGISNNVENAYNFLQRFESYDEDMADEMEQYLVTANAVISGIQSQRVEIYTTWDDDDATTDVAFKTVVPED